MISLNNISLSFSGVDLLDNINFHISENDKIGLVGKNGAGKSTIMKILVGAQNPTSGSIDKPTHTSIAYLPQIMEHHKGRTVIEETMTAFDVFAQKEKEIEELNAQLSKRTDYESKEYLELISRFTELNDLLTIERAESPLAKAEKTLLGLGFKTEDFSRKTETFSQGWNMRIELAKILLSKPDLLLLDEPTNHLDIESIEWLEAYLKNYKASIILVSHDRRFLDNITNRTIEIVLGKIQDYKVPYSKYCILREERLSQQMAAYENQQKLIEKTEEFIAKFRYKPSKSNQVQSRIKALDKLERIEIDESDNARMNVRFKASSRSGDIAYKATDLSLGYGEKLVFSNANIEIKRGDKVAFIGRNGEGKSTLMKAIMGEIQAMRGESKIGHNIKIGYFAQNQEDVLDKSITVFDTLDRLAVGDIRTKLRDILAQFLFRGEDIDKRVSVLSGGERARLAMAKLLLQEHNLLALDEPTNHMDIKSKDILKEALKQYDGTLLIVSHDRDFLDSLVDKVYEFRNGSVNEYLGGVEYFLEKRSLENLKELERKEVINTKPLEDNKSKEEKNDYIKQKIDNKEFKKLKNRYQFVEKQISIIENKIKDIEKILNAPSDKDDIISLTREYLEHKRDLDNFMLEWSELGEKLEY